MQVLYVSPMEYGANSSIEAMSHSLDHTLGQPGIELRVGYADFRVEGWQHRTEEFMRERVAAGLNALVLYTIEPAEHAATLPDARERRAHCIRPAGPPG